MPNPDPIPPVLTKQDIVRFQSHINRSLGQGPNGDCWEWVYFWRKLNPKTDPKKNYPKFQVSKTRLVKAHRLALYLATGVWAPANACHRCDNPPCCNPDHLFAGSHADNMTDMVAKKRHALYTDPDYRHRRYNIGRWFKEHPDKMAKGSARAGAKLTESNVQEIRRLYSGHKLTQAEIGAIFKVSQTSIGEIIRRVTWTHI